MSHKRLLYHIIHLVATSFELIVTFLFLACIKIKIYTDPAMDVITIIIIIIQEIDDKKNLLI